MSSDWWMISYCELNVALGCTLLVCFVYRYVIKTWWFFDERNLRFERGLPLIGTTYRSILGRENICYDLKRVYDRFPNEHIVGMYNFGGKPSYLIRDPELIKQVTITNFDHFMNHQFAFPEESEEIMGRSLLVMRNEKWRRMRAAISPAFTGSRMRLMHGLIVDTAKEFVTSLGKEVDSGSIEFDTKDLFGRYTNDIIANCAFGIKINSMENKTNEFFENGRKLTTFTVIQGLKLLGIIKIPAIMSFLKIKIFGEEESSFFRSVILNNVEQRIKNNIVRDDMIDLLIKARDGILSPDQEGEDEGRKTGVAHGSESPARKSTEVIEKWTDDDLVGQCFIFFFAGFDTVSNTFCFLLHELALNQNVQAKLYDEIAECRERLNGKELDYNTIGKMKYLDMVVSESMRRWSPGAASDRQVTKPIVLKNSDGTKVQLNVGDVILIPTFALHLDEKYFPNPGKFDPERFSDENKDKIVPGTYIPFGIGPRICIASRFALMELKTNLFYLLSEFAVEKCPKMQHPLVLRRGILGMNAEKGFWIQMKRRGRANLMSSNGNIVKSKSQVW